MSTKDDGIENQIDNPYFRKFHTVAKLKAILDTLPGSTMVVADHDDGGMGFLYIAGLDICSTLEQSKYDIKIELQTGYQKYIKAPTPLDPKLYQLERLKEVLSETEPLSTESTPDISNI